MNDLSKKKVWIEPGCITCGNCGFVASEVFEVADVSHIRSDADFERCWQKIQQAAVECPVQVIKTSEQ